jgi:exosome complex component RRP4
MDNSRLVLPGDEIGLISENMSGAGTYEDEEKIYSSLAGKTRLTG